MTTTATGDLFQALSVDERKAVQARYLAYLKRRDGALDLGTRRFEGRERFFAEVDAAPVQWEGPAPVSQAVFDAHHEATRPLAELDEATLWALCVAKANRGERYGVESQRERRAGEPGDELLRYVEIEEDYHTRILRDALAVIGVSMEVRPPPLLQKLVIDAMVRAPAPVADVVIYCGEILGVAMFRMLLEKARGLFASQPRALARLEALFGQIMVDEVGHVHFVRSRLGQVQLWVARAILPAVAAAMASGVPEVYALFGRRQFLAAVLRADVDAAAASYPDRFRWQAA